MKKWFFSLWCLLWACLALADEKPWLDIHLANQQYPPYMGASLPQGGILSQLVNSVFHQARVRVTYQWYPNKRALDIARNGQADGSIGWAPTTERQRDLLFTAPVMQLRIVFFQQRNRDYRWQSLQELAALRIGVTAGNFYSNEFEQLVKKGILKLDIASDDASNLRKLAVNRIDLFPMDHEAGIYSLQTTLTKAQSTNIVPQNRPLFTAPLSVAISRHHPQAEELVSRFNRELRRMHDNGQLQQLLRQSRQQVYKKAIQP